MGGNIHRKRLVTQEPRRVADLGARVEELEDRMEVWEDRFERLSRHVLEGIGQGAASDPLGNLSVLHDSLKQLQVALKSRLLTEEDDME